MNKDTENKKLGFYLSFKQSEKELYEKIRGVDNYSQLIKKLIHQHFTNENKDTKENNTVTFTVDDFCKVISTLTISNNQNIVNENNNKIMESNIKESIEIDSTTIPENMLIGL